MPGTNEITNRAHLRNRLVETLQCAGLQGLTLADLEKELFEATELSGERRVLHEVPDMLRELVDSGEVRQNASGAYVWVET